jgi:hypothetical protein
MGKLSEVDRLLSEFVLKHVLVADRTPATGSDPKLELLGIRNVFRRCGLMIGVHGR